VKQYNKDHYKMDRLIDTWAHGQ